MANPNALGYGQQIGIDPAPEVLLAAINNRICGATERVGVLCNTLGRTVDNVFGPEPQKGETSPPTPVPNGAAQQISMALNALENRVAEAESLAGRLSTIA